MDIIIYQPEDFIITQGSLSESLYFLAIGHLKVTIVDEKWKLHHLPTMIPGVMFGEIGLLCECKRTASVISDQYSTICNISKDLFQ